MAVEEMTDYARRVLTAVSQLTDTAASGTGPSDVAMLLRGAADSSLPDSLPSVSVAVHDLRQRGLIMASPSGQLRLTSAGYTWLAKAKSP